MPVPHYWLPELLCLSSLRAEPGGSLGSGAGSFARIFCCLVVLATAGGCFSHKKQAYTIGPFCGVDDPQFVRVMSTMLGPPMVGGNKATELVNGDQIFPAMLSAIRSAEHTITFETYIYWSGKIGREFSNALIERAQAGVRVHVIFDSIGSNRISRSHVNRMRNAGVEVEAYRPFRWYDLRTTARLNNRTHRKLLVVDGKIGFIGGAGIGDEWLGNAQDRKHWRDTHYRLEGPVVGQLQAAFMDNWIECNGTVLHGEGYFPRLDARNRVASIETDGETGGGTGGDTGGGIDGDTGGDGMLAQAFSSSAGAGGVESMQLMYLLAIKAARDQIRISMAYFVPDDLTIKILIEARRRGVAIDIIMPGPITDVPLARFAARSLYGKLLKAGVRIYEYQPTMYHCKVMIVDDRWVSIGSSNFDERSFKLNDEANVNVLDPAFAARQIEIFNDDLRQCKRITYKAWKRRSLGGRVAEIFSSLFRSQL